MREAPQGRVLVDSPTGNDIQFDVSFLERNGHPVTVCHGPAAGQTCPLLTEQGCTMYDEAHGIVFELDLDVPQHREILDRYRALNPDLPIRVVVGADQVRRYGETLSGVELWSHEPTAADLDGFAAEIEAADRSAGT